VPHPSTRVDAKDYAYDIRLFSSGHALRLLYSGRDAYPAMLEAIRAARTSVHLETHILRADATGERFADAMCERAGPMMHAKAAVVDGAWCAVGSYNLDYRSLLHDLEAIVAVLDRDFGGCVHDLVEVDLEKCRAITAAEWRARPKRQRILEWLAYRVRRWL